MRVERAFQNPDDAHGYVEDTYPYFEWYDDAKVYAVDGTHPRELPDVERLFVLEMEVEDVGGR